MLVISNRPRASRTADLKLLARLLPELYSTRSNYYYLSTGLTPNVCGRGSIPASGVISELVDPLLCTEICTEIEMSIHVGQRYHIRDNFSSFPEQKVMVFFFLFVSS